MESNPTFEFAGKQRSQHGRDAASVDRWLLNVVDLGLAGIILVAPYFFGGRHDLGRLVFVSLVAVTAGAWWLRQSIRSESGWRPTFAHGILLLAIGLVALQIVPLPATWIERLAPRNAGLLPLWQSQGDASALLGRWSTLSLTPHATTKALALLLGYSLLFVVVVQRINDAVDVRRLLRWIGVSAVIMATFGLLQYFTSNGLFFWFIEHPFRHADAYVNGSFINRNHFASFLVLGVGPLVAWLVGAMRQDAHATVVRSARSSPPQHFEAIALAVALTIVSLAVLLSMSRGGFLSLLASAVVLGAIYAHARLVDTKYLYGAIGLMVVVVGLLSVHGYDRVTHRLNDLTEGSFEAVDPGEGRRKIWTANIDAFGDGVFTGAGVGSHRMVYPVYLPESSPMEFTHAENGYLQIASETGLAGLTLLMAGFGLCATWCFICFRKTGTELERLCFGACAAGLAVSALHSLVDFVWYIPACMSVTVVLAGCTLRLAQIAQESDRAQNQAAILGRPSWLAGATLVVSVGVWMVSTFVGPAVASIHWNRYLRASIANSRASSQALNELVANKKVGSPDPGEAYSQSMLRELSQVVAWEPDFARAHLRLAAHLVGEFERRQRHAANPMDASQVRDAAMASQFASSGELHDWLRRAFGEDSDLLYRALSHAHAGVRLCPLQGEGYLSLANLCFLEGGRQEAVSAYIHQGLRVRPHDGDILFEAGRQRLLAGDVNGALEYWKECYRDAGPHQLRIVYLLAGKVPAAMFLATFQPDWKTLMPIWNRYRQLGQQQDWNDLVDYAYQATQQETQTRIGKDAANRWRWQATMFAELGHAAQALMCLEKAYDANPRDYEVRKELGRALLDDGQFAEAEPHLRWCLSRHPENKQLSAALLQAAKGRLAEQDRRKDFDVRSASSLGL
jgi:O-antigen ligase/tetratricopeptide (TPR) repeat protein